MWVKQSSVFTQALDGQAVVFLIEKKAGFLAVLHVDLVFDAVFLDFHHRVEGVADKALDPLHALLQADLGVAALVDAADCNPVGGENVLE